MRKRQGDLYRDDTGKDHTDKKRCIEADLERIIQKVFDTFGEDSPFLLPGLIADTIIANRHTIIPDLCEYDIDDDRKENL